MSSFAAEKQQSIRVQGTLIKSNGEHLTWGELLDKLNAHGIMFYGEVEYQLINPEDEGKMA